MPENFETQQEAFRKWLELQFARTGTPCQVDNLATVFEDGVKLCQLMEVLSGKKVKYTEPATNRLQKVGNVNTALECIKQEDIKLVGIGGQDIVDCNLPLIMGLIWSLILKYQSTMDRSALLKWCKETVAQFGLSVSDFGKSWQDGKALCALCVAVAPGSIDMDVVLQRGALENIKEAFEVAKEEFHVPILMGAEELANTTNPDEKTMLLYLSYFPKVGPREEARELTELRKYLDSIKEKIKAVLSSQAAEEKGKQKDEGEEASETEKANAEEGTGEQSKEKKKKKKGERFYAETNVYDLEGCVNQSLEVVAKANARTEDLQNQLRTREEELQAAIAKMEKWKAKYKARADLGKRLDRALQETEHIVEQYKALQEDLTKAKQMNVKLASDLITMKLQAELAAALTGPASQEAAPTGRVAFVFTDVQGSTTQWEKNPEAMAKAIGQHNALMRKLLREHNGYEVKTEGDAFMVTFTNCIDAANWCIDAQEKLLEVEWPEALLEHEDSREERIPEGEEEAGKLLWRGLRVRMGIHVGEPSCEEDPVTGRMDYFGPIVNRAARVASIPCGGQVVVSEDAWQEIEPRVGEVMGQPQAKQLGYFPLKGLDFEMLVLQLVPRSLQARRFPEPKAADGPATGALRDKLHDLEAENQALLQRMKDMESKAEDAREKAQKLKDTLQEMYEEFANGSNTSKLEALVLQMTKLLEGQELLKKDLDQTAQSSTSLVENVKGVENQMDVVKADVRAMMEKKLLELKAQNEERARQYELLSEELNRKNSEVYLLMEEKESFMSEFKERRQELENVLQNYSRTTERMEEMVNKYTDRLLHPPSSE
ncbi:Adenylate cyclase [Balamuthia mandrillaris]